MNKNQIFEDILKKEGGYVNHPADRGGPTMYGITLKTARAYGYSGDIKDLPRSVALEILDADYWTGPRFDQIATVSPVVAEKLCDMGVNMGPSVPSKFIQRWLSALNNGGKLYPDLIADGAIGPRTVTALRSFLSVRGKEGEATLVKALGCSQGARYLELAENREANEAFLYGWIKERVG